MAQITNAELQDWLNQHGGEVGRKDIEEEANDPSRVGVDGKPLRVRAIDRTEVTAKDGATITLRRAPGWLVSAPDAPQYDVTATTPPKATSASGDEEGAIRGPQTGPTREVRRGGQWTVEPNPIYQRPDEKPEGQPREGDTRGPQTGKTREVFRGGTWTVEPNPVYQEPKPEERAPGVQTVQGGDGQTYTRVVTMGPNNTPVIKQYGPNGQEVTAIPGEKEKPSVRQQQGSDGQTYTIVTTMDANNRPTVQTFGPDGKTVQAVPVKPVAEPDKYTSVRTDPTTGESMGLTRGANPHWEVIPVQGQEAKPTTRAPSIPQFIVGQSQDALRQAYDDIQAEVDAGRRTPAWGENRRKEVYETAQLTVNEAHLHEQSRQFNQSLSYNVANARMNNQQGVLEFALRSALSINGKIKKGSSAGAELFRGLFNLGMRMQADSGINNIRPGGGQSSIPGAPGQPARAGSPTTRPPMDPGDAKALAAHADQEATAIQARLSPTAAATRPWTNNETGPSIVNQPQTAPATAPVTAPSAAPPAPPPTAALPPREPVLTSPLMAPGPGAPLRVRDPYGNEFEMTQQQIDNRPGGSKDLTIIGPAAAPQAMTPPEPQFAAMEPFRMKAPQIDPLAAQAMDPMQGMGEMPAALSHTQIAATPPWLLPQDRLADLVGQYGEDAVFGYPGMPREAVA